MSERFVEFCSDGVLRVSVTGAMLPVSTLCDVNEGMPWWLAALPVRVSEYTHFNGLLKCLMPWSESIQKSSSVEIFEWHDMLEWNEKTPCLKMHIEQHHEMGGNRNWLVFMRGTASEDMGNPEEMPFDVLGKSFIHLSPRVLCISSSSDGLPVLDGAHRDVFSLAPSGRLKTLAAWIDAPPPIFSDFVNNCILSQCIKSDNPYLSMVKVGRNFATCY